MAETDFLNALPQIVVNEMRKEGKAVHAFSITEGIKEQKFGPYAAFFEDGKLQVQPFENFHDFEFAFKRLRK